MKKEPLLHPFDYYEKLDNQPIRIKKGLDVTLQGIVETATDAIKMVKNLEEECEELRNDLTNEKQKNQPTNIKVDYE